MRGAGNTGSRPFVTGVVIAAGNSRRLGTAKQLLPYRGRTLLEATLAQVRRCRLDQRIVTVGASADEIRATVDLDGFEVVHSAQHREGCASSVTAAVGTVDPRADGIVLLLGDQPGVDPAVVDELVTTARHARIAVCRYRDGTGHPFWLHRDLFPALADLHGDKAVWKLVDAAGESLVELAVDSAVPIDVDVWDDYHRLVAADEEPAPSP